MRPYPSSMAALDNPRDHAVRSMFDRIARRYDLLNRVISFRFDTRWRNQAIQSILRDGKALILDLGAGTGDLTFAAAKATGGGSRIIGLDFSLEMLRLAQAKKLYAIRGDSASFILGSALVSPFRDAVFDGVMTAFVLRNVSDLELFFAQAFRVLKPGGKFVSLDMFPPSPGAFSALYALYFYRVVPWLGAWIAHDRRAYEYLSQSVREFHSPQTIGKLIEMAGFERPTIRRFLHGAVCMHVAEKKRNAVSAG